MSVQHTITTFADIHKCVGSLRSTAQKVITFWWCFVYRSEANLHDEEEGSKATETDVA